MAESIAHDSSSDTVRSVNTTQARPEAEPERYEPGVVYGAVARLEAMCAKHPRWWEVTRWPLPENS